MELDRRELDRLLIEIWNRIALLEKMVFGKKNPRIEQESNDMEYKRISKDIITLLLEQEERLKAVEGKKVLQMAERNLGDSDKKTEKRKDDSLEEYKIQKLEKENDQLRKEVQIREEENYQLRQTIQRREQEICAKKEELLEKLYELNIQHKEEINMIVVRLKRSKTFPEVR